MGFPTINVMFKDTLKHFYLSTILFNFFDLFVIINIMNKIKLDKWLFFLILFFTTLLGLLPGFFLTIYFIYNWGKKDRKLKKENLPYVHMQKLATLGKLSASIAHELKSALTGISVYAHLVYDRTPATDKTTKDDIAVIIEQTKKCSDIVTPIVSHSKEAAVKLVPVNLNNVVLKSMSILKRQTAFKNIIILENFTYNLPNTLCNPLQLEQVFINLLMNAADAMENTGTIIIDTFFNQRKGSVTVCITDTGPGIKKEILGKIFEPFFTTKPDAKGTGLGLHVCRELITTMGGTISARNAKKQGATFCISLPIHKKSSL